MPDRDLVEADFVRRGTMMLPEAARYDVLLQMPKDGKLGAALSAAMEAVERRFPPLAGQLPRDYEHFEDDVLERMLRMFESEALRAASVDVFGRICEYFLIEFSTQRQALRAASVDVFGRICEYFLIEFSTQRAHDNGEFFAPPSIVQSSHFIEDAGDDTMKRVTFYGHGKNETTAKSDAVDLCLVIVFFPIFSWTAMRASLRCVFVSARRRC